MRLPHARILFVRRSERRSGDGLLAFVARSTPSERELRCVELERHDDLVGLDLATAGRSVDHPLFLVCTHGKHDRCCAKFGRPLYDAVREQVEDGWVWQSSHVGGDRFAGNVVVLDDGVYYGRVEPSEAWPVVEAALERRVHLPALPRPLVPTASPRRRRRSRCARRPRCSASTTFTCVRSPATARAGAREVDAAGTGYDVDVHVEEGAPTHLTCSTTRLSRPKRFVAGTPRVRAA